MRTPNRKHIRKGILRLYSEGALNQQYYSTGAATNGYVYAFNRRERTWHDVPENYFAAEFVLGNMALAYRKSKEARS